MASIFLGPSGSETALPDLKSLGSIADWPVTTKKQMEKTTMSDGSISVAFFGTKKVFTVRYGYLSASWLTTFKDLNALNQVLRFKNKFEENVWYDVVISGFTHGPERMDMRQLKRYKVSMTLEEV